MLKEQISKFCESEYDFYKRDEILKSDVDFSNDVWKLFAEQGWLSMPFSEEAGGFGFGPIELSILFEEFGKHLVIEPYLSTVVLSGCLLDKSSYVNKNSLISNICSGDEHYSLAYAEPDNRYNYLDLKTLINNSDDSLTLSGTKTLVLNASNSSKFIVTAKKDDSICIVIVNSSDNGITVNKYKTIDGQSFGEIVFDNVAIEKDDIVAEGDEAIELLNNTLNLATLCVAAEGVGCMNSCYLKTVEYSKTREQFDQPISNFQVLQHKMVDMFIESELAKSLLYKAMLEVDINSDEQFRHVSALKAQVGNQGRICAEEAIQIHGGMGVSEELMIGHYLKKLISIDALFGNADYHLNKFSS